MYTGGAFKVFSLVRSLRTLGMDVVVAGSQTGSVDDYRRAFPVAGYDVFEPILKKVMQVSPEILRLIRF